MEVLAPYERDYLLPRPATTRRGQTPYELRYSEGVVCSAAVLRELRPMAGEGTGDPLLPLGALGFWTEHSARCTLPCWAAAVGFERAWTDHLAWRAEVSEIYVRTMHLKVAQLQRTVAERIRSGLQGPDILDVCKECWATGVPDGMIGNDGSTSPSSEDEPTRQSDDAVGRE